MCITLLPKLSKALGQKRHSPGVNGCIVALGESINSSTDVSAGLVPGLDDRLIVKLDNDAVVVVVVAVVVTTTISIIQKRGHGLCLVFEY